ncbi:MAG: carboxypeptidase-like regulatory domain-containing protein [Flavobacteriaceae bacterium]|nr:carboxypeptidase-like regulatory domain-containing protein [Flavobacteriaceae bacterium]
MLIFFWTNCFSQEKYALISGKIISSNNSVGNVHIVNLNSKIGTVSNDSGEFELMVSLNDTLLFSSIEYERKKIKMTGNFIKHKRILVELIPSVNELDEIFIEGLTGNLNYDINKVPNDTLLKHNFRFQLSDLNKILPPDQHGSERAPYVGFFPPISGGVPLSDARYEAEQRLKREISRKKQFPIKIRKQLGLAYFTDKLKIPEEKIDNFLAYCEFRNIVAEYYKNNLLQVIQILREESENYHEIKE